MLLCQTLSDLRTGYSWQGDCCYKEDASRRQSERKEEKENEEREEESKGLRSQTDQ